MGVPPLFSTRTESRNGVARIALSGELDMSTVRFMAESLARFENDGVGAIILDLRELTFLDSAGLHAFLQARDRASKNGHRLVMVGASHQARRVFELTGTGFLLDGQDAVSVLHQFAGGTSGNGQARPAEGDAGG